MDAEQIRRALFPHEETIKQLQADKEELLAQVETLKAKVSELEALVVFETVSEVAKGKGRKRGNDTREES